MKKRDKLPTYLLVDSLFENRNSYCLILMYDTEKLKPTNANKVIDGFIHFLELIEN